MSEIDQLLNHSLFNLVNTVKESLTIIENDEEFVSRLSEDAIQTMNRARSVFNHLDIQLNSIDPLLFRKSLLDQINQDLSYINSDLINYKNNYFTNNLPTINQRLDNILVYMGQLPALIDVESIDSIRDTVSTLRRSVGRQKALLDSQQQEVIENSNLIINNSQILEEKLQTFETSITSGIQRIEDKYTELQQNFVTSQEARSQQFIDLKDQSLSDFRNFSDELKDDSDNLITSYKQQFDSIKEELLTIQEIFVEETKDKQNEYNHMLNGHKKSVEELVGLISTNTISGHFKEVADRKQRLASQWQIGTIVSFCITIGFVFYSLIYKHPDLTWPGLIARFIVTSAFGSITGYAARQATKNEVDEKHNRKMEVELKTLNPYLASFSPEEQIKLKEQLFPYIFGKEEAAVSQETTDQSPSLNTERNAEAIDFKLINQILDLVKKSKEL